MSRRPHRPTGPAQHGDRENAARAAHARRSAWILAGFAVFVYLGYLAWMYFGRVGGG